MNNVTLIGTLMLQRNDEESVQLFSFSAMASDILKWSKIIRTEDERDGTQRSLVDSKQKAVKRFLKDNSKNVIPSAVLLAFEPGTIQIQEIDQSLDDYDNDCNGKTKQILISFSYSDDQKPAFIVDGQHRLFGIKLYENEDIPVFVTALIDADLQERAFQFIVVNNKTTKVKTTNLKSIIANLDEGLDQETLSERLRGAGIRLGEQNLLKDINNLEESPFKDILNWEYNIDGNKIVEITAVENCLKYLAKKFSFFDDDVQMDTFFVIWTVVKDQYPDEWGQENSQLMHKVVINAVNEFLVDSIHSNWLNGQIDPFKTEEVKQFISKQVSKITPAFWAEPWKPDIRIADNANIKELIKNDLQQILQNNMLDKYWSEDVYLTQTE